MTETTEIATAPSIIDGFDWHRLAFDYAMVAEGRIEKETDDVVAEFYNISVERLNRVIVSEAFETQVEAFRKQIVEEGLGFKVKSRLAAERLVDEVFKIGMDKNTLPQHRLKAAEMCAAWGGMVPKEAVAGGGEKLQIILNIGKGNTKVIDMKAEPA